MTIHRKSMNSNQFSSLCRAPREEELSRGITVHNDLKKQKNSATKRNKVLMHTCYNMDEMSEIYC